MTNLQSKQTMRICLGTTLGRGASGDVYTAIQVPSRARFATKGMGASSAGQAQIDNELKALQALRISPALNGKNEWVNLETEEWLIHNTQVLNLPVFRPNYHSLLRRDSTPR